MVMSPHDAYVYVFAGISKLKDACLHDTVSDETQFTPLQLAARKCVGTHILQQMLKEHRM